MKALLYSSCFLFSILSMQSCNKNAFHAVSSKQIVIDTVLASGIEYKLNLQPYGDDDDVATITTQATAFTTSEIINAAGSFAPIYHYLSSANGKSTITDKVVISITEGSRNGRPARQHSDSTTITINFHIQ